jgi:transposase
MDVDSGAEAPACPRCAELARQVEQLQELARQLQQQVRDLQARLDQNSSNSHKPPSSDPPWAGKKPAGKKPTGRRPGGQIGHAGHHRRRLPPQRVDRVVDHLPRHCRHCRAALPRDASPRDPEPTWHQVAELPQMAAIVTEHRGHARACPCCGAVTRQPIPPQVRAHVLGPRLSATMSYLVGRCHDGRRTVVEVVADLFGVPLSLGTVSDYEREMSAALARPHWEVLAHVRAAAVKHVDETGWKRAGKRCWLWTAATTHAAAFAVQPGRNFNGLCALLGGPRGGTGVVCSDRLHAYSPLALRRRQLCWAHLKRDFQKWLDHGGATQRLGADALELTRQLFAAWRDFRQRTLTRRQLQRRLAPLRRRLRQVLTWALRCGVTKAVQFCRNLLAVEPALWTFTRVGGLEPTNNPAERSLRPAVLWRKNSFGCRSEGGCRFAERMLTAVQTLRLQTRPVLSWLEQALTAHRTHLPTLALA